jgi:HEAT repeat protein
MDDVFAATLAAIASDRNEPVELRASAAIALGPSLEYADILDPEELADEEAFSAAAIKKVEASLRTLYDAPDTPDILRRAALEASVRAPRSWHEDAVRKAHDSTDPAWRLTAVFCLRYVDGFAPLILAALTSPEPELRYQAMCAAGEQELETAWPHVLAVLKDKAPDREMLMAAIDAAARIRPEEAVELIEPFTDSADSDIAETALDALAMARALTGEGDEDEF